MCERAGSEVDGEAVDVVERDVAELADLSRRVEQYAGRAAPSVAAAIGGVAIFQDVTRRELPHANKVRLSVVKQTERLGLLDCGALHIA